MNMATESSFRRPSRHERTRERSPVAYLIGGSLLALWGFGLLLDNLGFGEVRYYIHRAWPAALVITGITLLIHRGENRDRYSFWGTASICAGLWIYAAQRDWIHVHFWAVLGPTLLVLMGASFVYRALNHPRFDTSAGLRVNTTLPPGSRLTTMS
jgi:hypothetical protein